MHQLRSPHDLASVGLCKRLMAQADPQCGNVRRQLLQHFQADPRLIRISRARRQQDGVWAQVTDLGKAERVVAFHAQVLSKGVLGGQLPEILHQVEGEAVVVVDDKQHRLKAETNKQGREHQQQSDHKRADGSHQHSGRCAVLGDLGQRVEASPDGQIDH